MPVPWTSSFCVFHRQVDEAPMMLTVDVGAVEHGPALTHPFRSEVRVPLQQPDANGFRTIEELEPMTQLEHRLTAMFERELNAWFVARFVWKGSTHLHYYHPMALAGPRSSVHLV